ncbi:hypothetical protein [Bradyrhizobium sp. BWA-3-5]|uniref:hypothetical protein n=1 Tax=Bradyrhizobium sp. BWA-3-5 TaxID=3080013 RepID=UPI00293F304B|nr:hypothetical protein [Bradyrhizobium sp. BWA-3-5]WOH68169.1 hypothetical protein RX331_10810 [Bradyrhizobium sp. BWA-3-5]
MDGMKRPKAVVLPDSALIPSSCQLSPAPNQFTHELMRSQPFYASQGASGGPPAGQFDAGAKVVLLYCDGTDFCRVLDGAGRYVETRLDGLRKLQMR